MKPLMPTTLALLLVALTWACSPAPAVDPPMAEEAGARALVGPMKGKITLDQGSGPLFRDLTGYSVKERFLYAVLACTDGQREGGFRGFFTSPEGIMGPEAIAGLRAMGMVNAGAVVQKAASLLGRDFPRDLAERRRAVEANAAALAALDAEFTQLLVVEEGGIDNATNRLARSK